VTVDALEAIKRRCSVRRFLPRPVARDDIRALVDAARLAPTADNAQPWEFVAVTRPELRKQIAALGSNAGFAGSAPVVIAVFCRATDHCVEDGCAAVENLLIAATARGLGSCWITGEGARYAGDVARLLRARGHQRLIALVAVGYAAESAHLRPTKRLLDDVLYWEGFS
jgi:nitroreductase